MEVSMLFRFTHIRNRIAVTVSMIVVGALLLTTYAVSYIYNRELTRQVFIITNQKMDRIADSIDEELDQILELQNQIQNDNNIQELMEKHRRLEQDDAQVIKELSDLLRDYSYSNTSVNSIFAFDLNKNILDPLYRIEPYHEIVSEFEEFKRFIEADAYSEFSVPTTFPNRHYNNQVLEASTITYFSKYINLNHFDQIGYIMINTNIDSVFGKFMDLSEKELDFAIVVDQYGRKIIESGEVPTTFQKQDVLHDMANQETRNIIGAGMQTYIINQSIEAHPSWTIIGGIHYNNLLEGNRMIMNIVILIGGISVLAVSLLAFYIAKRITKPIIEVSESMESLDYGVWPEALVPKTNDELRILVEGYNTMVRDIKSSIETIEKEQTEKAHFEINNLKLKLELLQSQINPHFVHNTLNSIKYLAKVKEASELVDLIESFNMLLRASMSIDSDFITVDDEMACVKSFMNIFTIRYDHPIDMIFDIDPQLNKCLVPKLILQPIVENSAYHGILGKGVKGNLKIKISPVDSDKMKIEVCDNGLGMSKEKVEQILSGQVMRQEKSFVRSKKGFNNIGLKNIKDRLQLYYGKSCQLTIKSHVGEGTSVSFIIRQTKEKTSGQ